MFNSADDMTVAPSITHAGPKALSEDEENAVFIKEYKEDLDQAIIRWWNEADTASQMAYLDCKQGTAHLGDFGQLQLDIPYGLANYLRIEYGGGSWEIFDDKDFKRYLQKAVGQTFLASI